MSTTGLVRLHKGNASGDDIPCIYITGFRSRTAHADDWSGWDHSHRALAHSPLRWCDEAYGFGWRTGAGGDAFGSLPLPVHTSAAAAALLVRTSSPATLAAAVVGDVVANATRLYFQFRAAEKAAALDAAALAAVCERLGGPYRVVSHSLGCRLVLEALPMLPAEKRPCEVHLCAAAATESHALPRLQLLTAPHPAGSGSRVYLYYSQYDEVLATAFRFVSEGEWALGSRPLSKPVDGVECIDVSNYFGLLHHGAYRKNFSRLVLDAQLHKQKPPPPPSWRIAQSVMLRDKLVQALQQLPAYKPWEMGRKDLRPDLRQAAQTFASEAWGRAASSKTFASEAWVRAASSILRRSAAAANGASERRSNGGDAPRGQSNAQQDS